ncbi:MAG: tripartite tricarboxylate transporter substrate binding protein, partial [Burkholderiales bacterium]
MFNMSCSRLFGGLSFAFALLASASIAQAQTFPTKPIKIVVPFGAGGVADLTVRTVGKHMSESLGQPVVIENKPGAGGVVATDAVAKAAPDGYTLLLMSNGNAVSAGLFNSLPFDTVADLAPISTLGSFDIALLVPKDSPYTTLAGLVAFARINPGKLNIGTINIGSTQNLVAELFKSSTNIDAQIVPFNGTPALVQALRGKQVDVGVEILAPLMSQIKGDAMHALVVMGDKRSAALPDVATAKESGVDGLVASSWNALAAPAKTPPEVLDRLNQAVVAAIESPEVAKGLRALNVEPQSSTRDQATALLKNEVARWGRIIERA